MITIFFATTTDLIKSPRIQEKEGDGFDFQITEGNMISIIALSAGVILDNLNNAGAIKPYVICKAVISDKGCVDLINHAFARGFQANVKVIEVTYIK